MEIAKTFTFDAAHILPNHDGKCARIHGHSYKVEVAVACTDSRTQVPVQFSDEGMIMDFAKLSKIADEVFGRWDHRFIAKGDEFLIDQTSDNVPDQIEIIGYRTTAENLAAYIAAKIYSALSSRVADRVQVTVWETAKARATAIAPGCEQWLKNQNSESQKSSDPRSKEKAP